MGDSAAEMIRRFREGKPTSREEREKNKRNTGVEKLWYETDGGDVPRALAVEPSLPPSRPSSALRHARQPSDYMSEESSLYMDRKLGESVAVDDLIEREIRQLEEQMANQDRRTNAMLDLGSFHPTRSFDLHGSMDSTRSSPGYRFTGHSSFRGGASPLHNSQDLMRMSGDLLRSSVETLGSTGFRGLLQAHLKLDGAKEEAPKEEKSAEDMAQLNKNLEEFLKSMQEAHPPKNPYFPEGVDESIMQITNKVHNDMLDFQNLFGDKHIREDDAEKAQKERDDKMREEGRKEALEKRLLELDLPATHPLEFMGVWDGQYQHPARAGPSAVPYLQPYAPTAHTAEIAQTTTGAASPIGPSHSEDPTQPREVPLETDLAALRMSDESSVGSVGSPFPQYNSTILSPEPSTGRHLPTIKEGFPVGNNESNDPRTITPATADKKPVSAASAEAAQQPTLKEAGILGVHSPRRARHEALVAAAGAGAGPMRGTALDSGLMQGAIDVEMAAAQEVYAKMRALRTGLGGRMRELDALHASLMPQSHNVGGVGPSLPLYARPYGPPQAGHTHLHGHPRFPEHPPYPQLHHQQQLHSPSARPGLYWGLEDYYAAQQAEYEAANSHPPGLRHVGVCGVAKGVNEVLDETMAHLKTQLPGTVMFKFSGFAPKISPTLAEATDAAATKVITSSHPEPKTPVSAKPVTPRSSVSVPTTPKANPVPPIEEAHKAAEGVVKSVLNLKEYEKKADGSITHTTTPATAAAAPVSADKTVESKTKPAPVPDPTTAATAVSAKPAPTPKAGFASLFAKSASVPSPLPKPPLEMLKDMDRALGRDDPKSNYLARDLLPAHLVATPTSLKHADGYLRAHYGPGPWDARMQFDARVKQQHQMKEMSGERGERVIIRAPTDEELRSQYGGNAMPSGARVPPSAPPSQLETRMHRPDFLPYDENRYPNYGNYNSRPPYLLPAGGLQGPSAPLTTTADPRRVIENANSLSLRRPVEGSALQYLRENNIGLLHSPEGNKYVNPYIPQASLSSTHFPAAPYARTPAAAGAEPYKIYADKAQYIPSDLRSRSEGAHMHTSSPTSVATMGAVHERAVQLQKMRQLRQNMLAL